MEPVRQQHWQTCKLMQPEKQQVSAAKTSPKLIYLNKYLQNNNLQRKKLL